MATKNDVNADSATPHCDRMNFIETIHAMYYIRSKLIWPISFHIMSEKKTSGIADFDLNPSV